jgi:tetratricopeptide (TPR) repeat protein
MRLRLLFGLIISAILFNVSLFAQTDNRTAAKAPVVSLRTITVATEPKAVIWLDDIMRGVTDESGKLTLTFTGAGARKIRVRSYGFKETTVPLLPTQKGEVKISLVKTTDEAEIAFQEAEKQLELDRRRAIEFYRKAIAARPRFPEAYIALARVLILIGDNETALDTIKAARKVRPVFPEASAIEGRIYKGDNEEDKAIASFKRAISEGKGFQPVAHTGLGLLYKDRAESLALNGDLENSKANYALAAAELKKGITQLSGAPDAKDIYQLLADVYYRAQKYQEAINTYEEYLRVFPDADDVTSIRSLIVQTRKEMNGEQ